MGKHFVNGTVAGMALVGCGESTGLNLRDVAFGCAKENFELRLSPCLDFFSWFVTHYTLLWHYASEQYTAVPPAFKPPR